MSIYICPKCENNYKFASLLIRHLEQSVRCGSSDNFISKEELISKSETIIIGAPHKTYDELEIPSDVDFVNIWK